MVLLLYLVCFVAKFMLIQCEFNITVIVNKTNADCLVNSTYDIPRGERINLNYENKNLCAAENNEGRGCTFDYIGFYDADPAYNGPTEDLNGSLVTKTEGVIISDYKPENNATKCTFMFYYLYNIQPFASSTYHDGKYAKSTCETNISITTESNMNDLVLEDQQHQESTVDGEEPEEEEEEERDPVTTTTQNTPVTDANTNTPVTDANTIGLSSQDDYTSNTEAVTPSTENVVIPDPEPSSAQSPDPDKKANTWVYVAAGLGTLAGVTIIGQTAGIMYFKAKAAKMKPQTSVKSLSEQRNGGGNDNVPVCCHLNRPKQARYSTMPGQKAMKIPSLGKDRDREEERESKIYETVNIHMTGVPPEPPAISTLPRLPRNHLKAEGPTHLAPPTPAMALRGMTPHPSPMMRTRDSELPRFLPATPVSQRPPLPLPTDNDNYEDVIMETEEDTYEPPPITETQQPRTPVVKDVRNPIPVPPKPVDRRPIPELAVTRPKPAPKTKKTPPALGPVTNELDSILQKRRNVMQVPNQSDPAPAISKRNSPLSMPMVQVQSQSHPEPSTSTMRGRMTKPRPPPPVLSKPVMKPPPMEDSEPCYEEYHDSSDEEWTYEPLKPIDPHIYQI